MAKKTKPPKYVWAAGINLNGLWYGNPIQLEFDKEMSDILAEDNTVWWDRTGTMSVSKLGLHETIYWTTFASVDKKEVERFLDGALAMSKCIKRLTDPPALCATDRLDGKDDD